MSVLAVFVRLGLVTVKGTSVRAVPDMTGLVTTEANLIRSCLAHRSDGAKAHSETAARSDVESPRAADSINSGADFLLRDEEAIHRHQVAVAAAVVPAEHDDLERVQGIGQSAHA